MALSLLLLAVLSHVGCKPYQLDERNQLDENNSSLVKLHTIHHHGLEN